MTTAHLPAGRLRSLDAFRGLAIAGMILVNNPGSWSHIYAPLRHAEWNGCTPTDLVFPFFLFIVGVALPFSFARRLSEGHSRTRLFAHVVRRSLILFGLGLFMAAFPRFDLANLRIMGVLQRIGVVYLLAAASFLWLGRRGRGLLLTALLLGYWALMTWIPVPGFGAGDLSPEGNLAAYLDRMILGGRLWAGTWDPEGPLSTLPAVATTLFGIYCGEWIRSSRPAPTKVRWLFLAGIGGVAVGYFWGGVFPVNKSLWTSSYVLFTGGAAATVFGWMYWLMEVKGRQGWAKPLVVYGMNAILVFVASGILARIMGMVRVGPEGVAVKAWMYQTLFVSWAGELNGSLAFALVYVLVWLGLMWVLFNRRIFIKI